MTVSKSKKTRKPKKPKKLTLVQSLAEGMEYMHQDLQNLGCQVNKVGADAKDVRQRAMSADLIVDGHVKEVATSLASWIKVVEDLGQQINSIRTELKGIATEQDAITRVFRPETLQAPAKAKEILSQEDLRRLQLFLQSHGTNENLEYVRQCGCPGLSAQIKDVIAPLLRNIVGGQAAPIELLSNDERRALAVFFKKMHRRSGVNPSGNIPSLDFEGMTVLQASNFCETMASRLCHGL